MNFPVHTIDSAPDAAKPTLEAALKGYGFLPNLLGMMATAPALVTGYATLSRTFDETSLTPAERQVVLLTASFENTCAYCMAAHSTIAAMQRVPAGVVDALRRGASLPDDRLEALRRFTAAVVTTRGGPTEVDVQAFLDSGFGLQQVLEVVLGVGLKTLSNYANHFAETPVDAAFRSAAWTDPRSEALPTQPR